MQELKKENNIISPYIKEFMTESTSTKTVSLTIGERLKAVALFDAFKGSISLLATIMDDVKPFPVTEEEWKIANLVKIPSDAEIAALTEEKRAEARQSWKWDEVTPKEITMKTGTVEYLLSEIKKKSDAGEMTIADLPFITLQDKLNA